MIHSFRSPAMRLAAVACAMAGVACTEPSHNQQGPVPTARVAARLDVSDSLAHVGEVVKVSLRIVGMPIASATGRIEYDSLGLAFVGEDSLSDGGTRVINPLTQRIRFAAIARDSFPEGRIESLYFRVKRAGAFSSLTVTMDEAHSPARVDAASLVRVAQP
jgi:hypothetical protein